MRTTGPEEDGGQQRKELLAETQMLESQKQREATCAEQARLLAWYGRARARPMVVASYEVASTRFGF